MHLIYFSYAFILRVSIKSRICAKYNGHMLCHICIYGLWDLWNRFFEVVKENYLALRLQTTCRIITARAVSGVHCWLCTALRHKTKIRGQDGSHHETNGMSAGPMSPNDNVNTNIII